MPVTHNQPPYTDEPWISPVDACKDQKTPSVTFPPMQEYKSALKAVRAKCLDCSGESAHEVRLCPIPNCPLFTYRFGKNPNRAKRKLTEEQRKAVSERLTRGRSGKST